MNLMPTNPEWLTTLNRKISLMYVVTDGPTLRLFAHTVGKEYPFGKAVSSSGVANPKRDIPSAHEGSFYFGCSDWHVSISHYLWSIFFIVFPSLMPLWETFSLIAWLLPRWFTLLGVSYPSHLHESQCYSLASWSHSYLSVLLLFFMLLR